MDELLQHCMRELAFDGDLGCDISRLRSFIQGFYTSQTAAGSQTVDDAFHAFVWSLLVQRPSVRVGLVPQGDTIEVYIAPQLSKKKKVAKPKKKQLVPEPVPFPALDEQHATTDNENPDPSLGRLQLIDDAAVYTLDQLIQRHGSGLRVAVDPETSFRAITGSHARPAKLSPMVYTALQLISRGRENGLSVVNLGKKTGYDQKTCFYLIKQLLSLDLVVKLGQGGPGGGNFCIHKYFYSRSAFWEGVRREEVGEDEEDGDKQQEEPSKNNDARMKLQFDPIDSRHLASTQLIKSRVVRLLKNSENGLHLYQNLLVTIGFVNPIRRDRRFFILRIRELIKERVIEKVLVPRMDGSSMSLCIRLVEDHRNSDTDGIVVQPGDVGDEEQEVESSEDSSTSMPVMNQTIHRQILNLLEQAGGHGLTLNNISARLGMFDKRTLELLIYRLERYPPPPHLVDLVTCDFIENQGRERRHRYFTLTGYFSFIRKENIDHEERMDQYTSMDTSQSGGFSLLTDGLFYTNPEALIKYEDEYRDRSNPPKAGGTRKMGRPRKQGSKPRKKAAVPGEGEAAPLPKPRGKKTKASQALADTEQGTDTQHVPGEPAKRGAKRKRKSDDAVGDESSQPALKKKRALQSKKSTSANNDGPNAMEVDAVSTQPAQPEKPKPKKRRDQDQRLDFFVPLVGGGVPRGVDSAPAHGPVNMQASSVTPDLKTSAHAAPTPTNDQNSMDISAARSPSRPPLFVDEDRAAFATPNVSSSDQNAPVLAANMSLETMPSNGSPSNTQLTRYEGPSADTRSDRDPTGTHQTTTGDSFGTSKAQHGLKRGYSLSVHDTGEEPAAKRIRSGRPRRHALVNISQLRAENEIIRVVEGSGGIVNVSSKEFYEGYAHVISTMTEAGEATSMPVGTQPDRRTINKIIERLAERGRIKTLTATLAPRVSQPRPVKLIYETGVTRERLDQYLSALREDVPVLVVPLHKKLDQAVDYTRPQPKRRDLGLTRDGVPDGGNAKENWRRSLDMMGSDEDAIRSSMLLELQTVAQLYGFLVGRARRARELHLFSLAHLQGAELSPHVVSRTERIIAFPYYFNDLPVSTYFAIISATGYSAELSTLMETPEGRQTPVKDLPLELHDNLKIGRARARDNMLGLFEILASLKMVTPLQPSKSSTPHLTCEPNGSHPIHFDIALLSKEKHAGILPPQYWQFNPIAPVHFYRMTTPWPPPFHHDMMVRTADESVPFWSELEDVWLNDEYEDPVNSMDSITGPCACTLEVARGLRRRSSWLSSYVLSGSQKQYLQQWTNPSNGYTPLSDPDGGRDCLEHLCRVISAPFDSVYDYFKATHDVFLKETERLRERDQRRRDQQRERQSNQDRNLLAKKAATARRQLETDWETLVSRAHPAPLPRGSVTRLQGLKARYMQSKASMLTQKWEAAVLDALSGVKSGKRNPVLPTLTTSISRKPAFRVAKSNLPPVAVNPQRTVTELIDRYRDKVPAVQAMLQRKNKKKPATGNSDTEVASTTTLEPPRRQRFHWTPEYDELARDVSAIIRARCRTWHRMDWTALEQVFPFLPRNSARQRLTTLRQEAGGETYLRLLEDKWHELWLEHRGTDALPDDNPTHPAEFDAIAHVEFLRRYIDKRTLRVGLSKTDSEHAVGAVLLEAVPNFLSTWHIDEKTRPFNKLDFMWTSIGDEHREKTLLGEAFSIARGPICPSSDARSNGVAESVLKMTLSTIEEDYNAKDAASLLTGTGQQAVRLASENLLAQGVVSEAGGRHRKRPGRKLKISALNEDALGGSFHSDFFSEACAIEDIFEDEIDGWREWSTIAADGEIAAVINLVSEGKVEFQIDISGPAAQQQQLDWNSKKVDDYQIETALTFRCHPAFAVPTELSESLFNTPALGSATMNVDDPCAMEHGQSFGSLAPCHKTSQGIITCSNCVDADQFNFLAKFNSESRVVRSEIIRMLDNAGPNGLNHGELAASLHPSSIQGAIDDMTSKQDPLCYWVGYTNAVLVSRRHISQWSVSIPGSVLRIVLPRRWLNIKGEKMENIWNAGLRAVVGVLVVRPGISQAELRHRLMSVYDRQELNDLLVYLWSEGLITKRCISEDLASRDIRALGPDEEQEVCWTLGANAWYRVNE